MDYLDLRASLDFVDRASRYRFHMPGHKGQLRHHWADLTELPGLDNLHHPKGVLARSQQRVADIYQAERTYYLVNGSSVGLMAAVCALAGPGDKVLVERNCHRAVIAGLIHSGATPEFVDPHFCPQRRVWLPLTVSAIESKMAARSFKAAIFTNPNYFGLVAELKDLIKHCREQGMFVIIDEAHGAHLHFGQGLDLPPDGVAAGAQIVVQSAHKTLFARTQAAWMHLTDAALGERLAETLNLFHTTSPSYPLLASLEHAAVVACRHGFTLLKRLRLLSALLVRSCSRHGLECWRGHDWTRFVLRERPGMIRMLTNAGIYPELVQNNNVLFMLTMADALSPTAAAALNRTLAKLAELPAAELPRVLPPPPVEQVCSPREAWLAPGKKIELNKAQGRICRELLAPYPPGTLVAGPGQRLDQATHEYLVMLSSRKVIPEWIEVI